jgi:hypothetical protein
MVAVSYEPWLSRNLALEWLAGPRLREHVKVHEPIVETLRSRDEPAPYV